MSYLPSYGPMKPWGVCLHTTGDGVPREAESRSEPLMDSAVRIYTNMKEGPHFVIDPEGNVKQLRAIDTVAYHCGISTPDRRDYLSGAWESKVDAKIVAWWKARWPGRKSPQHLFPSRSPNLDFIGIEHIPCGTYQTIPGLTTGSWRPIRNYKPAYPGSRFTAEQYIASTKLVRTFEPVVQTHVVGHEDINPKGRPGWDPGDYHGWWSWPLYEALLR